MKAFDKIRETRIVSILRGIQPDALESTLEALYAGGIRCVEITLNTPSALPMIERAAALFADKMVIGAGTVLDAPSARQAILAGASFVLAPTFSREVVEICAAYSCLSVPGVFSPTEIFEAWKTGAQIVKVFPCGSVGPAYIKDVRGPLPQIRMMPVGGVTLDNARAFFDAGSFALGVGSSLFDPKLAAQGDFAKITRRAQAFLRIAREARE